jgi:23S rRNA (cytidine2498-2'-O)-methyltransferase
MSIRFPGSQFAFALCQPGTEPRLKAELRRLRPTYHPAFQRPGLVTFKAPSVEVRPDVDPRAMFARAWGCAAGPVIGLKDAHALIGRINPDLVFVGPRVPGESVSAAWLELRDLRPISGPQNGQLVMDVILAEGEPAMLGWHVHGCSRHLTPSGIFDYPVPAEVPSRAYGKAIEGLQWSGATVRAGEVMLEIGAAPGGTTLAYLERGLLVVAVDTQELAPVVRHHPGCLAYVPKSIGDVTLEELPTVVHWIGVDAGIAPNHVVRALRRLTLHYRRSLRGMLLTLKLNDAAAVAAMPGLLEELKRGGATVDAIQLPTNRSDLFVFVSYERTGGNKDTMGGRPAVRKARPNGPMVTLRGRSVDFVTSIKGGVHPHLVEPRLTCPSDLLGSP